jgi:hypothetical protein
MSNPADFAQVANVISTLAEAGQRPRRGKDAIPAAKAAGPAIGEKVGEGRAGADPSGGNGSIESPLKETDAGRREYHPAQEVYDADGTLVKIHPIKTLYMRDAGGNEVKFEYAMPDYNSIT